MCQNLGLSLHLVFMVPYADTERMGTPRTQIPLRRRRASHSIQDRTITGRAEYHQMWAENMCWASGPAGMSDGVMTRRENIVNRVEC